ncbi:hypothetical protein FQN50_002941 [Emmonsiellopsis sp. PD_5]|nr:hypothetical protein FQN50_002941 [Emmonsiellopsis sp. PD_5]
MEAAVVNTNRPTSSNFAHSPEQRGDTLADQLKQISLEAGAERHLGSSSGISFAKLTQAVLRRLSPDQEAFVFDCDVNEDQQHDAMFMPELVPNINSTLIDIDTPVFNDSGVNQMIDVHEGSGAIDLALLEPSHVNRLLEFYFAHSHTLYPIIRQNEFTSMLWKIYSDPLDPSSQSPLWLYRVWMILAIGSTTYSSVSLVDESESVQFFNKAMTYFEPAMGCGDLVSYSFFNKIGPNTWLLVGIAARMATGMGLHTSDTYTSLPVDVAEFQKRLFFSLYMMDRVVSMALGRPFAIQDHDIDIGCFSDVDDEQIHPDGIIPSNRLEPSSMAVPLHILGLRNIASDIGNRVHSIKGSQEQSPEEKEQTIQSIHKRLIEWRRSMPFPLPDLQQKVPHLCTSWFDFNYYTHVIMLYRPSPLYRTLNLPKVRILADASAMAIRQAISMHRQNRFSYNWLNLLAVFNSALSLMFSTTAQPDQLSLVLERTNAIDDLELAIELLEAFDKKFPSAKKIQRMIQVVVAKLRMHAIPED